MSDIQHQNGDPRVAVLRCTSAALECGESVPQSDQATECAVEDGGAAFGPEGAWDWTPPPLKQYPSPAYTTGQNPSGFLSANAPVDVNGILLIDAMMQVRTPVGRWHYAMRRIVARRAAWRDPAPGYDRSTLPSYDSLEFDA